jgi:hypothetical protein
MRTVCPVCGRIDVDRRPETGLLPEKFCETHTPQEKAEKPDTLWICLDCYPGSRSFINPDDVAKHVEENDHTVGRYHLEAMIHQ